MNAVLKKLFWENIIDTPPKNNKKEAYIIQLNYFYDGTSDNIWVQIISNQILKI